MQAAQLCLFVTVCVLCSLLWVTWRYKWFVLQVESVTNHDVKAIEYIIKDRISHNPELAKVHTSNQARPLAVSRHFHFYRCCILVTR